jgi:cob(I)alamin adenosyltransferase
MAKLGSMAVNLTRIYTRTGDDGSTRLGDMSKTSKTDPRLIAYADTDEANSSIGVAIALGRLDSSAVATLTRIQNELFDVGADLCNPVVEDPEFPPLRVEQADIDRLERDCDHYNEDLEKLRSFILPGGTPGSALLHVSRTVVRRAERSAWTAVDVHGSTVNVLAAKYLNRLSDLLFILARYANKDAGGDVLWVPGGSRQATEAEAEGN